MVAREWGVLPSQAALDLDDDPEQLALACIPLLRYAQAHAAFKRANKTELKGWRGVPVMDEVEVNAFELAQAEIDDATR